MRVKLFVFCNRQYYTLNKIQSILVIIKFIDENSHVKNETIDNQFIFSQQCIEFPTIK